MKFDPYDYIGVIIPGTTVVITITFLFPNFDPVIQASISLGDLGLILILSFLAGHLLQAAGNFWEWVVWGVSRGKPSTWAARESTSLLTTEQLVRLDGRLQEEFGSDRSALAAERGITKEIVVRIRQAGSLERIDKFNRVYGLMRGVSAGLILSAALVLFHDLGDWRGAAALAGFAGLATYRMVRFGVHYAREVFVEYLSLPKKISENPNV